MTYANQKVQVLSNIDTSHEFDICAGVRQGCVLSPRLFCSVLQLAMGRWRSQVEHLGLNLGDGSQNWKCSAGSKLWITGKVLREMRFNGMLCFRLS